jgi:hypothetical protein
MLEQKIEELTRKCNHRDKISLNVQYFDETKRKYNDEIHRLYDQVYLPKYSFVFF